MANLVDASGYGATRFKSRFAAELGLTPKQFIRLVRFRQVLDSLHPDRSLAAVALAAGYGDQSHMNRDFRELGGTTPSDVLKNRYPAGLTLAEQK